MGHLFSAKVSRAAAEAFEPNALTRAFAARPQHGISGLVVPVVQTGVPLQRCLLASHLFLFDKGQVLLQRRFQTGYYDGHYSVPAGKLDDRESPIDCIARESMEEIGLPLLPEQVEMAHVMHHASADGLWVNFFLTRTLTQADPRPRICEPDKSDELRWCDPESLPPNTVPYVRAALASVIKGERYSELSGS